MSNDRVIYLNESTVTEGDTKWSQALPEIRWVSRPGYAEMLLQQRWRVWGSNGDTDGERREWRDVPTVKEG